METKDNEIMPQSAKDNIENEFKIMGLFIDNAKTYTQLAGAGLAVSVVFIH